MRFRLRGHSSGSIANGVWIVVLAWLLMGIACAPKRLAAPPLSPAPGQNVFVLLPDPEGKPTGIVVKNPAGTQELNQAYQAIGVERIDVAPGTPFTLDPPAVRRLFGSAMDVLPAAEVLFTLYYDTGSDVINAESKAQLPRVLKAVRKAIREGRSTAIAVTGHTDTTAAEALNYQLGLRRARGMAAILSADGVNPAHLFVRSHGYGELRVETALDVAEAKNRRVEIIVR